MLALFARFEVPLRRDVIFAAVADHARRQVVFSHPPRNTVARAIIGMQNLFSG